MRRALLTVAKPSGPIAIGNPAVVGTATAGATVRLFLDQGAPATGSGTLTTVNFYAGVAGTIYVMTGTVSGTNYTVRAITSALTVAAGVNALPVSLPVATGDFIAYYSPSSGGGRVNFTSGGGSSGVNTSAPTAPPVASDVLAFTPGGTGLLSIGGTG